MSKILKAIATKIQGFTLIELLAVMAIVAILASIVAVSVSGSGQTSRDTQVQEDANAAASGITDFFDDQPVTELLESEAVTVLSNSVTQEISKKWPEQFITEAYPLAFETTLATVNSITFLDEEGATALKSTSASSGSLPEIVVLAISANSDGTTFTVVNDAGTSSTIATGGTTATIAGVGYTLTYTTATKIVSVALTSVTGTEIGTVALFSVGNLLTDFNALDLELLEVGGYVTQIPDSFFATSTDNNYPNYLWLLEKDQALSSTGSVSSRNVSVYVLLSLIESTVADDFDLTFLRLQ